MTGADYVCYDSEGGVMKECLVKGYFQDWDKGLSCKGLLPR